ncbi:hypothetical protein L6164_027211 [Bauhinia variegata]|uniref:Uncharacterized protein n=1 Tax=Bauhinia variegata TaxID=167791 RepID=A0ACB9LTD0_BAUVA|nr:hypothetical protein L6164_027211 [Bauhinia variegata]
MAAGGIEESSVRLLSSTDSGSSGSRWVDGSEVEWEAPWTTHQENQGKEVYGSFRRRLVKKPKRVDSFDVEAMEIAGGGGDHGHSAKDPSLWPTIALAFQTLGVSSRQMIMEKEEHLHYTR